MSVIPPRRLGRYDVSEVIGTGAFATVYRARDDRLDSEVALKVLAENHSFDADIRERFITEGHLLRRVDSPHVVTVFDLGETDSGQPYLVLELATGGDLAARRRALAGTPILDHVLPVARQLAAALGALHAQQVVHRDVAPGNLLIRRGSTASPPTTLLAPGDRLLLADLGLSKDLAARSGLTVGAGTAGFTPPEQGVGGWVDARADIWSASALLVWLALGTGPDRTGWERELHRLGWPAGVVAELQRGLGREPGDRHESADAWLDALEAAAAPVAATAPAPAPEPPPPRLARGRTAAVALVVAVLLAGGGWYLGRSGGEHPFGTTAVVTLDDGQLRATVQDGSARLAITGPGTVAVGDAATYTATTSGVSHPVWLAPDGRSYPDERTILVRPTSGGVATVRLLGRTAGGDVRIAELQVTVTGET